jgi:hypothetical protein
MSNPDKSDSKVVPMRPRNPNWADLPVHPAADMWPRMSDEQIAELAKDIQENGLLMPVIVFEDNSEEPNGVKGPFPRYKLDGRSRDAALRLLGITDPDFGIKGGMGGWNIDKVRVVKAMKQSLVFGSAGLSAPCWEVDVDPYAYVLTANAHRLHLNSEQKRQAIEAYRKVNPTASNRQVARATGTSPTTVGKEQSENVQIGQISTPHDRAKTELLKDPDATNKELAKRADVSDRLLTTVRREAEEAGEIEKREVKTKKDEPKAPKTPRTPTRAPRPTKEQKDAQRVAEIERTSEDVADWLKEHAANELPAWITWLKTMNNKTVIKLLESKE